MFACCCRAPSLAGLGRLIGRNGVKLTDRPSLERGCDHPDRGEHQPHHRLGALPPLAIVLIAALGLAGLQACGSSEDSSVSGSGGYSGGASDASAGAAGGSVEAGCSPGTFSCHGSVAVPCDETDLSKGQDCAATSKLCVDGLGCRVCSPGTASCSNGLATYCSDDGTETVSFECDPLQGMVCESTGCTGACATARRSSTNAGCEFWPTITANTVWKKWFQFGVLLTNLSDVPANVTVAKGNETVKTTTVPASGTAQIELPWIDELKGPDAQSDGEVASVHSSILLSNGAYRLRSDQPLTAMQFSTTQSENPTGIAAGCPDPSSFFRCFSYSNDASLLVPSQSLGSSYSISGWHSWTVNTAQGSIDVGDFVAITAIEDSTTVKLTASGPTLGGTGIGALSAGESATLTMSRGDVLQVFSDGSKAQSQWGGGRIVADKSIQVIGGSPCANVPEKNQYCDHLEESLIPDSALGTSYIAAAPKVPNGDNRHLVRIHAFQPATLLEFEPGDVQSPVTIGAGESFQVLTDKNFEIKASSPVSVSQFLIGLAGSSGSGIVSGDPSQSVLVPKDHYLTDYSFATSSGYSNQDVAIVVQTGSEVRVQGKALAADAFVAIGASGWSVTHLALDPNLRVTISSEQASGVQLYGYGPFTSYQVPAGINLQNASKK